MTGYDAFLSYAHEDKLLAEALQRSVQVLGKPWYRRRSLRIFRDDANLSATAHLWPSIERALRQSRFLILLASRESAASTWVAKEVATWLEHNTPDTILIGLSDGELTWNESANDFDWSAATPLPAVLKGRFGSEPRWVDLRAYRSGSGASKSKFAEAGAEFAAAIHGIPKEDLLSEELRQQRRALLLSWSAVTSLLLFSGVAVWQWTDAVAERKVAQVQRDRADAASKEATANADKARANEQAAIAERNTARVAQARAQRNESLTLADQSLRQSAGGDGIDAIRLALAALPKDRINPERPLVPKAEFALGKAVLANRLAYAVTPSADWINDSAFSPDGSQIAMGTRDGFLKILDAKTGREIRSAQEGQLAVLALAYSTDGKLLATAHQDPPSVQVRDAATGALLWKFRVSATQQNLRFTPDGTRLISAGVIGDVRPRVWDLRSGALSRILDMTGNGIWSLSLSPDNRLLAVTSYDGLFVWEIDTGKLIAFHSDTGQWPELAQARLDFANFEDDSESIKRAQFASTGELVALGKRTLYVIDPRTRAIARHWRYAETWQVTAGMLLVSSDAQWAVLSTSDTELATQSLVDGRVIARHAHASKISSAALSPDDTTLVAIAADDTARVWKPDKEAHFAVLQCGAGRTKTPLFSPDGTHLITYGDKTARIWDVRAEESRLSPLPARWRAASVNAAGTHAFAIRSGPSDDAGDNPDTSGLWNLAQATLLNGSGWNEATRPSAEKPQFSTTGNWLVVERTYYAPEAADRRQAIASAVAALLTRAGQNAEAPELLPEHTLATYEIIEVASGLTRHAVVTQDKQSYDKRMVISDDGSRLGLAWSEYGEDGVESQSYAEIWDTAAAKKLWDVSQAGHNPSLWLTSDLKTLVMASSLKLRYGNSPISIWNLANGSKIAEREYRLNEPANDVRLVESKNRLILGAKNSVPAMLDLSTGREIGDMAGKAVGVGRVAISRDRQRLLVDSVEAPRSLWDLNSRKLLSYVPPDGSPSAAAFTDDGSRILVRRVVERDVFLDMFDSATGRRLKQIGPFNTVSDWYAGLTGAYIVVQTGDRTIEIHDVDSAGEPRVITLKSRPHRWRLASENQRFVTVDEAGQLQIWDARSGELVGELAGTDPISPLGGASLALHRLPVILADGRTIVVDTDTGRMLWQSPEPSRPADVMLAPDGRTIVFWGGELAQVFDVESGARIEALKLAPANRLYVSFNASGDRLLMDNRGATSVLLDLRDRKELARFDGVRLSSMAAQNAMTALAFGKRLLIVDGASGETRHDLELPQEVRTVEFDDSGEVLAIVTAEPKVLAFNVSSGKQDQVFSPRHHPSWIKFGANPRELIIYEDSNALTLRDIGTGKLLTDFAVEWPKDKFARFDRGWIQETDPTATYVGVRAPDNYIRAFRTADGSLATHFSWDDNVIADLMFSSDGQRLILATEKGYVLFWNNIRMEGDRIVRLDREYSHYQDRTLLRTPDPARILAVDPKGRVDLISTNTFESRLFFTGQPDGDVNAVVSEDGDLLATMGANGILRIWHIAVKDVLLETRLTEKSIYSPPDMRFSPDGRFLIIALPHERPLAIKLPPLSGVPLLELANATIARAPSPEAAAPPPAQKQRLGVFMSDVSAALAVKQQLPAAEGALVLEVLPDSVALSAGVRKGDIILQVDETPIKHSGDVRPAVEAAGVDLTLLVLRRGERMTLKMILGDATQDRR